MDREKLEVGITNLEREVLSLSSLLVLFIPQDLEGNMFEGRGRHDKAFETHEGNALCLKLIGTSKHRNRDPTVYEIETQ